MLPVELPQSGDLKPLVSLQDSAGSEMRETHGEFLRRNGAVLSALLAEERPIRTNRTDLMIFAFEEEYRG